MGVTFYQIENIEAKFELPDGALQEMEDIIIEPFNAKYNDLFDRYGTFRLYSNHLEYFCRLIYSANPKAALPLSFLFFLEESIKAGAVLQVEGD